MADTTGLVFQHVLVMGGEAPQLASVAQRLETAGHACRTAELAEAGVRRHREEGADVVVILLPCADLAGDELLRRLLAQDPRALVLVTGRDDAIQGAPDALGLGATDYLLDPLGDPTTLLTRVDVSLGTRKADAQLRYLRRKDAAGAHWQAIVGQSPQMRRAFATIRQICHRTSSGGTPAILITGETGTGKGLMAKAVHYNSVRRSRAFVDVNCAAMPATMMEAELFGHVRGAFTDARASRAGLFETADGGTLFLDEIGALSLDLQAKLLTAIEEKSIRRLGSSSPIKVDAQIVAATHRDLEAMVKRGEFRADLFHRLNVITVHLPPLAERGEDRVQLAEVIVAELCAEYGVAPKRLSEHGRRAIESYGWPGNVRELRNQLERIVLLHDGQEIGAEQLALGSSGPGGVSEARLSAGGRVEVELPEESISLEALSDALERTVIAKALERLGGNVSQTARYLQITRQALIYRMRKHGLRSDG